MLIIKFIVMTKALILEKGDVKRILEWFKLHKDEEYADILEGAVKEHREEFTLR